MIEQILFIKISLHQFRMSGGCGQNMNHDHMGTVVLAIWPRGQPFLSPFVYATELYFPPSGGLYRTVCLPEWCIIKYGLPIYYDSSPKLLWPPQLLLSPNYFDSHNYYDSQDMVSPNYWHHNYLVSSLNS